MVFFNSSFISLYEFHSTLLLKLNMKLTVLLPCNKICSKQLLFLYPFLYIIADQEHNSFGLILWYSQHTLNTYILYYEILTSTWKLVWILNRLIRVDLIEVTTAVNIWLRNFASSFFLPILPNTLLFKM